jgi:hypothetical protein
MTMTGTVLIMVETVFKYGLTTIVAKPMRLSSNGAHPLNPSEHDHEDVAIADLQLRIGISSYGYAYNPEVVYRDCREVTLFRAKTMAKTLAKIGKVIDKDGATEPGDVLMAFARAIGATLSVERASTGPASSSYSNDRWIFGTIGNARDAFRSAIKAETKPQEV